MDIAVTFLTALLLLHLHTATGTYIHPNHVEELLPIENTINNEDAETVGGILGLAHLHALRARARVHAIQRRTRLRTHPLHPHLLFEPTPEELMNNAPPEEQNAEPILGQANPLEAYPQNQEQPEPPNVGFSNIPSNWKPPPNSNLYEQHNAYPSEAAVLSIVPGQWKNHDDCETYDTYYITPIAYNIPDDYPNDYHSRSADPHKIIPNKGKRHFHSHGGHVHSNSFAYHGKPISDGYNEGGAHQPSLHESFSSHSQSQEFHVPPFPPPLVHDHQQSANKQNTVFVLPPSGGNFQISQVSGYNNAVAQSQNTRVALNAQSVGIHNGASQSHQIPSFVGAPDATLGVPHIVNVGRNRKIWTFSDQGEDNEGADIDPIVGAPNVFSVGRNRKIWNIPGPEEADVSVTIKRSVSENSFSNINERRKRNAQFVMGDPNEFVDAADSVLGAPNVFNVGKRRRIWNIARPEEAQMSVMIKHNIKKRQKRTVPLLRLLVDPNTRMDVPKTIENMGTVARNSFENKRAPVYHLKNAMGSAKDVFMSSLRIPPQDLFIPSKYKIVEKDSDFATTPNEVSKQSDTYNKVGEMFRESVRSGQNALSHVGDFTHSARKALATTRHAAPRVVLSSLRIPAVERKEKAVLITPKVIQTRQEGVGAPHHSENDPDFVGVHHVLDVLGVSNPHAKEVESRRIIFEPIHPATTLDQKPQRPAKKYYVFSDVSQEGYDDEKIHETLDALDNAKKAVGANTLKEFFGQLKNSIKTKTKQKMRKSPPKLRKTSVSDRNSRRSNAIDALDMVVSLASNVTNELLNESSTDLPISDSAEEMEVSNFLRNLFNVSNSKLSLLSLTEDPEEDFLETNSIRAKRNTHEGLLRAINPVMFEQMFNSSLESAEKFDYTHHPDVRVNHGEDVQNQTVGIGMTIGKALLIPFMGKLEREEVYPYDYSDAYPEDDYQ